MTDEENWREEPVVVVAGLDVYGGTILLDPHECSNPEHNQGGVAQVVILILHDSLGEKIHFAIPIGSSLVESLCNGDFGNAVKEICERLAE